MKNNQRSLMPLSAESGDEVLRKVSWWNNEEQIRERQYWTQKVQKTFSNIWDKYVEFRDFILKSFPPSYKETYLNGTETETTDYFLTPDLLRTFLSKLPEGKRRDLETFHQLLDHAQNTFHSVLCISRVDEDTIEHWSASRSYAPEPASFVLDGERAIRIKGSKLFTDSIKITDRTSRLNIKRGKYSQFMQILAETDPSVPAIIEYSHKIYGRKLLLVIPELISWSEVKRYMDKELSRVHQNFYKTVRRGRPKSKDKMEETLAFVLKDYTGKKFPLTRLSEIASKKLEEEDIKITPSTIRRHYIGALQKVRCAKKIK